MSQDVIPTTIQNDPVIRYPPAHLLDAPDPSEHYLNPVKFHQAMEVAKMFAQSDMVPDAFKKNIANCFIGCQFAFRLGIDPFMVLQNMYVIGGKPALEAKLVIALINTSRLFQGSLQWEMSGEGANRSAKAWQIRRDNGQKVEAVCDMETARAEGWLGKNGSKWKTIPELMLRYRAASFFARLHCPERLMGMSIEDEVELEREPAVAIEAQEIHPQPEATVIEAPEPSEKTKAAEALPPKNDMTKGEMQLAYTGWTQEKKNLYNRIVTEKIEDGVPKDDAVRIAFNTVNT